MDRRLKGMCLWHAFSNWKDISEIKIFQLSATNIQYNRMRFCVRCGKIEAYYEQYRL